MERGGCQRSLEDQRAPKMSSPALGGACSPLFYRTFCWHLHHSTRLHPHSSTNSQLCLTRSWGCSRVDMVGAAPHPAVGPSPLPHSGWRGCSRVDMVGVVQICRLWGGEEPGGRKLVDLHETEVAVCIDASRTCCNSAVE